MLRKEGEKTHQAKLVAPVLFLILAFHTFEVHGTLYSNGLTRYGRNVCATDRSKSVSYSIRVTTTSYQRYTTSCGLFGWARCQRSRSVTSYRYLRSYTTGYDTYLSCCSGWRRSGSTCPIAICRYGCSGHGSCVSPNSCSCNSGWTGSTCGTDINECLSNNGGCQQRCTNGRGYHQCGCYRGYKTSQSNSKKCIDVNECSSGTACNCTSGYSCGARCRNTQGGFRCSCGSGYRLQKSTLCTDINECAVNYGGCSRQCINYPGGYRCTCPRGFRLVNSKRCQDVNECDSNNGNCEHTCQNLFGGHRCKCNEGFILNSNGRTCSDMDECKLGHDCEDYCSNTHGGYSCSCKKGYQLRNDNRTCADIDECAPNNITGSKEMGTLSGCHHVCSNVQGSYQCSCRSGYKLMYDKKQCQDIDECQTGNHLCQHNCHNTDGSYRCTCKAGYKLSSDGKTCEAEPCEKIDPPWQGRMQCSGMVTDANCAFSCNPGYDLVGPQSRTCLPSSRWSGNGSSCKAKHCETLTTKLESQTLSVPCFTSFGSTCYFGCRRGYVLYGDRQANCSLNSNSDSVSWKTGQFFCQAIKTCQPNPCRHEGKCVALDENSFICNCDGTGYKGDHCEVGVITTPIFPKLRPSVSSHFLNVLASPSKSLRVSLDSEEGTTFDPSSLEIKFPKQDGQFTVEAAKPGIQAIRFLLEGENKDDFETPEKSVLFVAPEISNLDSKPFLLKGELPVGCQEQKTKDNFSCQLRLLSTAPWTGTPLSTNGVVHFTTVNNQTIPLSLIGLNFTKRHVSRDEMIETGIVKTSTSKKSSLLYQRGSKCYSKLVDSNNLLELIDNDAFVSSFMHALSAMAPEWLTLAVSESNQDFDIQNIAVTLASDLKHCSGFPLYGASSLAYYRPAVNYKIRVDRNDIPLSADGRTCFAINICKPGLFINFPKNQAKVLKSNLKVFRDMKDCCGLDLSIDSIGFRNKETSKFAKGMIWNGRNLQTLSPLSFNAWLKGRVDWRIEIPKLLFVTFKMTGETFIKSRNIDSLFTDRMSQRMEMQLKGKAFVNITGRALKKSFSLELGSSTINGKAVLGGQNSCNRNVQGVFITLERSVSNLLNHSPLSTHIRPVETEPVRLAILVSLTGGRQSKIRNIRELKRFLKKLISLTSKVQNVLREANSSLPQVTENFLEMTQQLHRLLQEMETVVSGERTNVTRALSLLNHINSKTEHLKKIIDFITPMVLSSGDFSLLRMVFEISQANFPKPSQVNLGGEKVETSLQGISFYLRTNLCMGQLCFNDLKTTVDYLAEGNCFPNVSHAKSFHAKGKVVNTMSLSEGNILTLPKGQIVYMVFPRNSEIVSAHFVGEIRLFGLNQNINITLDKKQLSFQMQGKIFSKYMADMNVTSKTTHNMDWSSLIFTVEGRMTKYSLLSQSLQTKVTNIAKYLAQKAAKRVGTCNESILLAEQRVNSVKKLFEEKRFILKEALQENHTMHSKLQRTKRAYEKASLQLNSSLTRFLKVKNEQICELQTCRYIDTDTCIPAVCQEEVIVNHSVPNCRKEKETIKVDVIVSKEVEEVEWVKTSLTEHHSDCVKTDKVLRTIGEVASYVDPTVGSVAKVVAIVIGSIADALFGCDDYKVKVPGPMKKVMHKVTRNFRETKTDQIDTFVCEDKTEFVISGYGRPYECCKKGVSGSIKVLDPNCVSHNSQCLRNMSILAEQIEFENITMFGEFQTMTNKGKLATVAQLEANKAKVKLDVATKQFELTRARLYQHQFAKKSINLTTVTLREKVGLKLGEKMKNLKGKALVSVDSLAFSVTMTRSSTKRRFPVVAYLSTFEGAEKAIQFSMDFKNENSSLALASRLIIETLFGTSQTRRRRSTMARPQPVGSRINGSSFPLGHHECLFLQEARIFFIDIVQSLDFTIKSKKELDDAMSAGLGGLEKLPFVEENADDFSSGHWQQIHASFSNTIQYLKDTRLNSSGAIPWNNTLDDVRGFLDVLSREKNFTDCSGIQDCTDFFFDSLEEMYEMEHHPRAIEIKATLQSLERIISSMLKENHEMSTLESMISRAKFLISNSSDDIMLCGKKPEILRNSPVKLVAILGETVNLVCEAKSTLEVEYLWIKNDKPLEGTNSTTLEVRNVTKQSEGAYKCQASNNRGSAVSNVTIVEIHQKPIITKQPPDAQRLVGDDIYSMVCNSTGVPLPLTEWFFIPMKAENYQVVRLNTTMPVLRMSNLSTAKAGFYFCNVSNLHGTVQSRVARLDVLRFVPGVPRIVVSMKLTQCKFTKFAGKSKSNCKDNSQQVDGAAFEYISRKMLERMNWSVEEIGSKHYKPFPNASVSFVVNGDDSSRLDLEGKKLEALYSFSLTRKRMGDNLKKLYAALEDESLKVKWKNLIISGTKESLVVGFLPQWCPKGTRRHENGFLCVYCLPGYYGEANTTCIQCPVGTYQPDEGSTECVKCPFPVSYTEPGAIRESQCIDISILCKSPEVTTKYALAPKGMKNLYRGGETIVLGCIPGYRVVGNGTRECDEGNWTNIDFYCERTCFPPWTELKKRCYLVIESPTHRWKDASAKCQTLKSHMVTISSEEENHFTGQLVKVYLEDKEIGQVQMWLGLRRMHTRSQLQWVDGSPLEGYTNWTPGEPNNANGRELCTEMLVSKKFWLNKWNDVNCDGAGYKTITVCEKPLVEHD